MCVCIQPLTQCLFSFVIYFLVFSIICNCTVFVPVCGSLYVHLYGCLCVVLLFTVRGPRLAWTQWSRRSLLASFPCSSDRCHDREATMMGHFSIVVTETRAGHKQRPSVSIPSLPSILIVFPIMCFLTHLICFPSSVSLVFRCLLPLKHPLKPLRLQWV